MTFEEWWQQGGVLLTDDAPYPSLDRIARAAWEAAKADKVTAMVSSQQMPSQGFKVVLVEIETGETYEQFIAPGMYAVLCREPVYQDGEVHYGNGTTVITLKLRQPT